MLGPNNFRIIISKSASKEIVEAFVDAIKTRCGESTYQPPSVVLE